MTYGNAGLIKCDICHIIFIVMVYRCYMSFKDTFTVQSKLFPFVVYFNKYFRSFGAVAAVSDSIPGRVKIFNEKEFTRS